MTEIVKKIIDNLDEDKASVSTIKTKIVDGEAFVSPRITQGYINSELGRLELAKNEPQKVINSILDMWGETPTQSDDIPQ